MTTAQENHFHAERAKLQRLSTHWQDKLNYGDPAVGWEGDRALALYHEPLTAEMVVYYELPNQKPVLVAKVDVEGFDIHRLCTVLRNADGRRHSTKDVIARVDAQNDKVDKENEYTQEQSMGKAKEKLQWALAKDSGRSIAPLHVTKNPAKLQ